MGPNDKLETLMTLNLTEEGITAGTIINVYAAKTPFNNYKKDNQDLRPDEKPYFTITTSDGKIFHF